MVKKTAASAKAKPCGANTPVTWGALYLMLENHPADLQMAILRKIAEIDQAG